MFTRIKYRVADGNVLALACAFAIGLAMVGLISAGVQHVLMPILNTLLGVGANTTITIPLTSTQAIDISAVLQAAVIFALSVLVASVVLSRDKRKARNSERARGSTTSADVTDRALSPHDLSPHDVVADPPHIEPKPPTH